MKYKTVTVQISSIMKQGTDFNEFEFPKVNADKKNRQAKEWKLKPLVNKRKVMNKNESKLLKELYAIL